MTAAVKDLCNFDFARFSLDCACKTASLSCLTSASDGRGGTDVEPDADDDECDMSAPARLFTGMAALFRSCSSWLLLPEPKPLIDTLAPATEHEAQPIASVCRQLRLTYSCREHRFVNVAPCLYRSRRGIHDPGYCQVSAAIGFWTVPAELQPCRMSPRATVGACGRLPLRAGRRSCADGLRSRASKPSPRMAA